MTYAKTGYLQNLKRARWPAKHIDTLAHFFIALKSSLFRVRTHGEKILITYQSRVRRHWHDQLKSETGDGFNIALINNGLLESISNKIWDKVHARREVSNLKPYVPFHKLIIATKSQNTYRTLTPHHTASTMHATRYMTHTT